MWFPELAGLNGYSLPAVSPTLDEVGLTSPRMPQEKLCGIPDDLGIGFLRTIPEAWPASEAG